MSNLITTKMPLILFMSTWVDDCSARPAGFFSEIPPKISFFNEAIPETWDYIPETLVCQQFGYKYGNIYPYMYPAIIPIYALLSDTLGF